MRCLLLLLLGLLVPHQSCCFEFVIDGGWEEDAAAARNHEDRGARHKRAGAPGEEQEDPEAMVGEEIKLTSFKVESRITLRFALVTVRSSVFNPGSKSQSVAFNMQIPKRAFISNFNMNVNGVKYVGSVKEKTLARKLYAQARSEDKAAGIVRTNSQELHKFITEVNVPSGCHADFELHYQEMMERKQGCYEHLLFLQPGRLAQQFQVDVHISEPRGIASVQTSNTLAEQFAELVKLTSTEDKAHVVFKPTLEQQRKCEHCTSSAIDGVLSVKYDVNRDNNAGELQVSDNHFFYFFAPSNNEPICKHMVLVIDVSGSMWGVKMKQMVAALKAILDDLTVKDYFSIIDFNHNVRCWSEDLVPASSINVADAKKYIEDIKPNGGTNINEALVRAAQMLTRASSQNFNNVRTAPMAIVFSDGDPTVGETKLNTIQKNVRRVMREEFSVHCMGIGHDMDFDFLERISMENRGMAQRIYANHDAAEQIRAFYNQISSPQLRNVAIQFPKDSVADVTRNQFNMYYSGSELVVAGRVLPSDTNTLTSFTTASAATLDLTLQSDADITELDGKLAQQQHSFNGFARQMWACLTIQQLMAERSLATTAVKKRTITQKITTLSMDHQVVTPYTALLIEGKEGKDERLLADSPRDSKHGCCSVASTHSGPTSIQMVYATPPPLPAWVDFPSGPSTNTGTEAQKGPVLVTSPLTQGFNRVDDDPHFIIRLPGRDMDVCFNIDSKPGHILNVLSDAGTGVAVNGQLIGSKRVHKGKLRTYFGVISVYYEPEGFSVTVSTDSITTTDGRSNNSFTWGATAEITRDRVRISIVKNDQVTITVDHRIQVMVPLHRVWKKHPVNVDFLGIYLSNSNQYSPLVHGLIGQFSREPDVKVYDIHEGADPLKPEATMEVKSNKLHVTRGWQKDYRLNKKHGSLVYCWFVHNSGKGFIDGHYTNYIVPDLSSFLQLP